MSIRCKMRLENIYPYVYGPSKAIFRCEYDPALIEEDVSFAKSTPSGMAEFTIDSPLAAAQMVIGSYYYFDISPVPFPTDETST